jgi:hypothetical protein
MSFTFRTPRNPLAPSEITKIASHILECEHCLHPILRVTILFNSSSMSAPPVDENIWKNVFTILIFSLYKVYQKDASSVQYLTQHTFHFIMLTDLIAEVCTCTTLPFTTGLNHRQKPTISLVKVLTQQRLQPHCHSDLRFERGLGSILTFEVEPPNSWGRPCLPIQICLQNSPGNFHRNLLWVKKCWFQAFQKSKNRPWSHFSRLSVEVFMKVQLGQLSHIYVYFVS